MIFFSQAADFRSPQADHTWIVEYAEPLPEGMTTENCWLWRLTKGKLLDASEIEPEIRGLSKDQLALKRNKDTLMIELGKAVDHKAAPYLPRSKLEQVLHDRAYTAASAYMRAEYSDDDLAIVSSMAAAQQCTGGEYAQRIIAEHAISNVGLWDARVTMVGYEQRILRATDVQELEKIRRELVDMK